MRGNGASVERLMSLLALVAVFVAAVFGGGRTAALARADTTAAGAPTTVDRLHAVSNPKTLQLARRDTLGAIERLDRQLRSIGDPHVIDVASKAGGALAQHQASSGDQPGEQAAAQQASSAARPRQRDAEAPLVVPYSWGLDWDGTRVELSGYVLDANARKAFRAIVSNSFNQAAIVDKMVPARGAPDGWMGAAIDLAQSVAPLDRAKITMLWRSVLVEGHADEEGVAQSVRLALHQVLPAGYRIHTSITFDKPTLPVLQPYVLTIVADNGRVELDGGVPSPELRQALLDDIAKRFLNAQLADNLRVATGSPPGWEACVKAGLAGLSRLSSGAIHLHDDELRLSGRTEDETLSEKLAQELRAAANRACNTSVAIEVVVPPELDLTWEAVRRDGHVELSGEVPDSETRAQLLEAAKQLFPKSEVHDLMRVKPGRSQRWTAVAKSGLELLSRLRDGRVKLSQQHIFIAGNVPDAAALTAVRQRLESVLPKNYRSSNDLVVQSDAMIWAEQAAQRKATLEAEQRRKLDADQARRREETIRRELDAQRRRQEFDQDTRRQSTDGHRRGDIDSLRKPVKVGATHADDHETRSAQQALDSGLVRTALAVARLPHRGVLAQSGPAGTGVCGTVLSTHGLRHGQIRFPSSSKQFGEEGRQALDRLASIARDCPSLQIDIAGHTDALGRTSANLRLSRARANAVADYLQLSGVSADRLRVEAHGEAQPFAPNTTPANRALNRRVEFTLRANSDKPEMADASH